MCLNQVNLIGYAGNAPQVLKENKQGKFVLFSLATTTKYMDKETGQLKQKTEWHTVYANNGRGTALAAHLQKGALLAVVGEIRYSKWKDKEGQTHHVAGIHATKFKFLGKKPAPKEEAPQASAAQDAEMEYELMT